MFLFKRLQRKLQISEDALKQRIQRKANKEGISTSNALVVLAALNGIGIQSELKKLGSEDKSKIQLAISQSKPLDNSSSQNMAAVSKLVPKKKVGSKQENLFFETKLQNESIEMAEKAYIYLYCFENSLRTFINKVMTKYFGQDLKSAKFNNYVSFSLKCP